MRSINIGLLTSDLNSPNMGCNALTYNAILLLENVSNILTISFNYFIFNNDNNKCIELYPNLLNKNIKFVKPAHSFKKKLKNIIKKEIKTIQNFEKLFKECDIFFEISGGDSFSDIYGMERLNNIFQFHKLIMKLRKPLVFLPQTIGPFYTNNAKKIASMSLDYAKYIFVRDPISNEKASEITNKNKISQSIDMAFFMEYDYKFSNKSENKVGINPSGLLWNGGYSGNNQFGIKSDYDKTIYSVIELLLETKYEVHLVPHVLHGPGYIVEDDYKICKHINKKYSNCKIAPFFYTPVEAKNYISSLDLLIGSRLHCCIAAFSSGVPILPLAYSRKFKGLFEKELHYQFVAELKKESSEDILFILHSLIADLPTIKQKMTKTLEKVNNYHSKLISELKDILVIKN